MTILIPAYEPDLRLLELIQKLKAMGYSQIVIVDDGSGKAYRPIFHYAEEWGCTLLTHPVNRGKGLALKTGFLYIKESGEQDGVICADSDGQHLPEDIIKIAREIGQYPHHIILGCRRFNGKVPCRSRFGNTITRWVYTLSTGSRVYDTQTGLRGYSVDLLDWLCRIPGERFEYEMNMLLEAGQAGYGIHEVDISTVYHGTNQSSHFRLFSDSVKIYLPLLKFSASSILSGILDFGLLLLLQSCTSNLLFSAIAARLCSSAFNYFTNRTFVFKQRKNSPSARSPKYSLGKYYALVALLFLFNYGLLSLFSSIMGVPLFFAKLLTEGILFIFSYLVQRQFVFKPIA